MGYKLADIHSVAHSNELEAQGRKKTSSLFKQWKESFNLNICGGEKKRHANEKEEGFPRHFSNFLYFSRLFRNISKWNFIQICHNKLS